MALQTQGGSLSPTQRQRFPNRGFKVCGIQVPLFRGHGGGSFTPKGGYRQNPFATASTSLQDAIISGTKRFFGEIDLLVKVKSSRKPARVPLEIVDNHKGVVLTRDSSLRILEKAEWEKGFAAGKYSHIEYYFKKPPKVSLTKKNGSKTTIQLNKVENILCLNILSSDDLSQCSNEELWLSLHYALQTYEPLTYLPPLRLLHFNSDSEKKYFLIKELTAYITKGDTVIDFHSLNEFFKGCLDFSDRPVFDETFQLKGGNGIKTITFQIPTVRFTKLWKHLKVNEKRIKERMRLHLEKHLENNELPTALVITDPITQVKKVDVDACYNMFIDYWDEKKPLQQGNVCMCRFQVNNVSLNIYDDFRLAVTSASSVTSREVLVSYFTRHEPLFFNDGFKFFQ